MLGLYVSDHPLMGAEASLRRRTECSIAELEGVEDGSMRVVGGLVTSLQRKWTKKGDLMAVFVLEDLQSSIEVMVFPKTMQQYGHLLADDAVVCMKGRVDGRDDTPKLMAMEIEIFEPISDGAPPVRIRLTPNALSEPLLAGLKGLLGEHPGESEVLLHLGERQVVRLPDEFNVDASNGLVAELRCPARTGRHRGLTGPPRPVGSTSVVLRVARIVRDAGLEGSVPGPVRGPCTNSGLSIAWQSRSKPRTARRSATRNWPRWPTCAPTVASASRSARCPSRPRRGCSSPWPEKGVLQGLSFQAPSSGSAARPAC